MRKRHYSFAVIAAAAGIAWWGMDLRADENETGRFVQLVYHSDTRGYYQPCG